MKLDFLSCSLRHYIDYLAPLYLALPDEYRGDFFARGTGASYLRETYDIPPNYHWPRGGDRLFIVAGQQDAERVRPAPCVLVNHGAGQTYSSDHASYSAGTGRENVVLHLCPSQPDAELNRTFAPSVAVGPYRLDPWLNHSRKRDPRHIVISFHHDANLNDIPEAQSAFPHYRNVLKTVAKEVPLVGHGHPRHLGELEPFYHRAGMPVMTNFRDVLDTAAVFCVDNSSTLWEAAAVGIPVIVLNAPWYRRDVHHGLRFWWAADVGEQVNEPDEFLPAIYRASKWPQIHRDTIVSSVYSSLNDGHATERTVRALVEFCGSETQGHSSEHPR